jgi:hypothetical protein
MPDKAAWYTKIKKHLSDIHGIEPDEVEPQLRLCAARDMCLRTGMEIPQECLDANICTVECSPGKHLDLWCSESEGFYPYPIFIPKTEEKGK